MNMNDHLKHLLERETDKIDSQKDTLKYAYEVRVPAVLERLEKLTSLSQGQLLHYAVSTSHQYASLAPHQVLEVVLSFYLCKFREDQEKQEDEYKTKPPLAEEE